MAIQSSDPGGAESPVRIEGSCTECGAPFEAGIWDHSVTCGFCGSRLVAARALGGEVFVVADLAGVSDPLEVLIRSELEHCRSEMLSCTRDPESGLSLEIPAWVDAKLAAREKELRAELELLESVDFFAPYRIREQTVFQGVLGRRGAVKESFVQSFSCEQIHRLYDPGQWNLRDRGLKIFGLRLQLISDQHFEVSECRFLDDVEAADGDGPAAGFDRSGMRVNRDTQIISRFSEVPRERDLKVYKHLTYARIRRAHGDEHYLVDRQFGGLAGTLSAAEAERYRDLPSREASSVLPRPEIRSIASECPNCGHELELPPSDRIVFCPNCRSAVSVGWKGLEIVRYRHALRGDDPPDSMGMPFWAFPFRLQAESETFTRVWDWLERVSPQPLAEALRETDPDPARIYVPARHFWGAAELDDAFVQLVGWATWRQAELASDRPDPRQGGPWLGVELEAGEARDLLRMALLALHDVQSTRRLNGRNFAALIRDAQLACGEPELVVLPLALQGGRWQPIATTPGSTLRGLEAPLLLGQAPVQRRSRAFALT